MSSKNDAKIKLNPQVEQLTEMPKEVVVIPIVNSPIFPGMIAPIILSEEKFTPELDQQISKSGYVALNLVKFKEVQEVMESLGESDEDFEEESDGEIQEYEVEAYDPDLKDLSSKDIYKVGVLCKVVKKLKLPDGSVNLLDGGIQITGLKVYNAAASDNKVTTDLVMWTDTDALNIKAGFEGTIELGNVVLGSNPAGASIGSVAINNLAMTGATIKISGH